MSMSIAAFSLHPRLRNHATCNRTTLLASFLLLAQTSRLVFVQAQVQHTSVGSGICVDTNNNSYHEIGQRVAGFSGTSADCENLCIACKDEVGSVSVYRGFSTTRYSSGQMDCYCGFDSDANNGNNFSGKCTANLFQGYTTSSTNTGTGPNQGRGNINPSLPKECFQFTGSATSAAPSESPSDTPSDVPSLMPSESPSDVPSTSPSDDPSLKPSDVPSDVPSSKPSDDPSSSPSEVPSDVPSVFPSDQPSSSPSEIPSVSSAPSDTPSDQPSSTPSDDPSSEPSSEPSSTPSCSPSNSPTASPSVEGGVNLVSHYYVIYFSPHPPFSCDLYPL